MSKLAEQIAREIMTMEGCGEPVDRIALMKKDKATGEEKECGGRIFRSVVWAIDKALQE